MFEVRVEIDRRLNGDEQAMKAGFAIATFLFIFFGLAYCIYCYTLCLVTKSPDQDIVLAFDEENIGKCHDVSKTESDGSQEGPQEVTQSSTAGVMTTCDVQKCAFSHCDACKETASGTIFVSVGKDVDWSLAGIIPAKWIKWQESRCRWK
jgi:hypothetical protein